MTLPPPDVTAMYVDAKTGKPTKEFFNYIKSLSQQKSGGNWADIREWGVVGDDVVDDTVNFRRAITEITSKGEAIFIPNGTYKLTGNIEILQSNGWAIRGESMLNVKIKQYANDTPIWNFRGDLTHSWYMADLFHTWNTPQDSSFAHGSAFWFAGDGLSRMNFVVERCVCDRGYRFFTNSFGDDMGNSALTWGCTIRDCIHYDTNSGGFWNTRQDSPGGQPNVSLSGITITASNNITGDPLILHNAGDSCSYDHIECLDVTDARVLVLQAGGHSYVGSIKLEIGTYNSDGAIYDISDTNVFIASLSASTLTINGCTVTVLGLRSGGAIAIGELSVGAQAITGGGKLVCAGASGLPLNSLRIISPPFGLIGTPNMWLTDVPSTGAADGVVVDDWQQSRLSPDIGDANYTWTIGASPNTILCQTTLTADRDINITDAHDGPNSNLFNGFVLTVVRNAGAPGAFNLNVRDYNGGIMGQLASTNGSMSFMWRRFGWTIVNYATWTGTTP
jgi:hypothetical protein